MKPETKTLRAMLRELGVRPVQVRTDHVLHGTTATIFDDADIAAVVEHTETLADAGYAVDVRRDEHGTPYTALVTTDPRRTTAAGIGGAL